MGEYAKYASGKKWDLYKFPGENRQMTNGIFNHQVGILMNIN